MGRLFTRKLLPYILSCLVILSSFGAILLPADNTSAQSSSNHSTQLAQGNQAPPADDDDEKKDDGEEKLDCEGGSIITDWVICPMIKDMFSAAEGIARNMLQPYLTINPLRAEDDNSIYKAWLNIRNIANIAFIITFLMVVFSQATSMGISNYGIKKLLPKLVIVAVATNLSFFICAVMVDAFNVAGLGMASFLTSVLDEGSIDIDLDAEGAGAVFQHLAEGTAALGLLIASIPLAPFLVVMLLLAGLVIVMVLFAVLACLIIRQLVIIVLVMISPLAFVAWLLPNTEKLFSRWFSTFMSLLIMFPIIMLLFASSTIVASLFGE